MRVRFFSGSLLNARCLTCPQAATSRSIVALDELGRGTATTDGAAVASAVLQHLGTKVGCRWGLPPTATDPQPRGLHRSDLVLSRHRLADRGWPIATSSQATLRLFTSCGTGSGRTRPQMYI